MNARKVCAVAVVGMFVVVSALQAEGFYIGGYGAYSLGGDVEESSLGYGANLGFLLGDSFGLELSGTLLEDDTVAEDATEFELGSLDLSLLYYLPVSDDSIDIYVGIGASYNRFNFDSTIEREVKENDQIGFFGSAGVAILPAEWLRVFADVRYNVMQYEFDIDGTDSGNEEYSFFMVRVGAGFAL